MSFSFCSSVHVFSGDELVLVYQVLWEEETLVSWSLHASSLNRDVSCLCPSHPAFEQQGGSCAAGRPHRVWRTTAMSARARPSQPTTTTAGRPAAAMMPMSTTRSPWAPLQRILNFQCLEVQLGADGGVVARQVDPILLSVSHLALSSRPYAQA